MGYAPHHLASQGAGCRSCLKRQFGKKSPQGEALTKAKITLFAEENFVSKILCRQEGKPRFWRRARISENKQRPSSVNFVDSFPPRGSL